MAEMVDCLDGRAVLGTLPYRQHISIRLGEYIRDWALTVLGERKYGEDVLQDSVNRILDEIKEKTGKEIRIIVKEE